MLFVFDWDGTLCNSTDKIVNCMQAAAKSVGLNPLVADSIKNIIGLGLPEAITQLYPHASDSVKADLKAAYSRIFTHEDRTPSPFFDGVEETLHSLRDQGYQITIATGKSRAGLDRVLAGMGMAGFFHSSRCADETMSKPHPQMLFELLGEHRFEPQDAVMVGDTEYDMEMARRAGMPKVAVSYGAHDISRLKPYDPLLCLDSFAELLTILAPSTPDSFV